MQIAVLLTVKSTSGNKEILVVIKSSLTIVSLPKSLEETSVTSKLPSWSNRISVGFCCDEFPGIPPSKVHSQFVGTPKLRSVKSTLSPKGINVSSESKSAKGLNEGFKNAHHVPHLSLPFGKSANSCTAQKSISSTGSTNTAE